MENSDLPKRKIFFSDIIGFRDDTPHIIRMVTFGKGNITECSYRGV